MKRLITLVSLVILCQFIFGQISGTKTIPSTNFPTIMVAVDSLNIYGVGTGGVTFNVDGGYTESITDSILLTATGTVSDPIVFQLGAAGANPLITRTDAGVLATSTLGGQGDAIIIIQGSDYVTFDQIDVAASQSGIEYGYYLRKASGTNGCKNVTISNSTITMTKGASQYVVGIYSSNNDASSAVNSTTGITITSTGGRHESVSMTGNTISNVFTGILLRGYAATTPYDLYDQNFIIGTIGRGNTIQNYAGNAASASYGVYIIYHNNVDISYNIIDNTAGGGSNFTSTGYGIFQSTATNSSAIFNNNEITLSSNTGQLKAIMFGTSSSGVGDYTCNENSITLSQAGTSEATGIYATGTVNSFNISSNIFSYGSFASTTTSYLIYASTATNNVTISGNVINGTITKTASGTFYGYYNFGSPTGGNESITGNDFSNISITTGSSSVYGIYSNTSSTQNRVCSGNTVTNLSHAGTGIIYPFYVLTGNTNLVFDNTVSDISGGGTIYALYFSGTTPTVYNNNVFNVATSGATLYGIYNSGSGTTHCYQNQVYNLSSTNASPTLRGIYITTGTSNNVYNNFVSDLRTPSANTALPIAGIYVSGGTAINLFYNTVYLNASSSGATFGNAGIYASSTPAVDMRNNVIVNVSSHAGTASTVAYQRSSTTLTSYSANSNNNDFYAGTPGPNNLIFYDGTNSDQTIAAYKARVTPRDAASFAENPPFINIALTPYNLHMQTSIGTQCESGGTPVSSPISITTDFDGNTRNVTLPDVGADEFNGVSADFTPPAINYALLPNISSTTNRPFANVDVTDGSGVDGNTGTRPRVYYKRKTDGNVFNDNTSGSDGWKWAEANGSSAPFDFTINYSLLNGGTGVVLGDTVQYFVVAQDLAGTPNVGINSGTFASAPTSVALTPAAFPIGGTINYYKIVASIGGIVTVGSGGDYPSLTGTGGLFEDINSKALISSITANILSDISETGVNALNQMAEDPQGSNFTLTIQPSAASSDTLSGKYSGGLIRLNGADRVIFDGRYAGSGSWLVISNDSTGTNTAAIQIISLGVSAGATDNVIRNCNIAGGSNSVTSAFGIYAGGATISTSGTGADNDNLSLLNNTFNKCYYAIFARGVAGSGLLNGLTITGNTIGSATASKFVTYRGIDIQNAIASNLSQNEIFNLQLATSVSNAAIDLGQNVTDAVVSRNKIHGLRSTSTGGYGTYGINISSGTGTSNISIYNNLIYDLITDGDGVSTTFNPYGIRITGGTDHKVYYNSVNMYGSFLNVTTSDYSAAMLVTSNTVTGLDLRDNIFVNTMTGGAGAKCFAIYVPTGMTFGTINYNDYYVAGVNGILGYYGADVTTLAAWQTASSGDANSLNTSPGFQSDTDLRPSLGNAVLTGGTPIAGITIDYIGTTRSGTTPAMGAYENGADVAGPDIVYTPLNGSSSTTTLSFSNVAISDPSGLDVASGTKPRVYYKRTSDGNTWNDNTNGTDGWKYKEANGATTPFDFTIDYSLLNGGTGVSVGDTVEYFVVAQDLQIPPFVGINSGTFAATPSSVNLTASAFPIGGSINYYKILSGFAGNYNIGSGQTYRCLTADADTGFFKAINSGIVSGNITVTVTSDLAETGAVALNQWIEEGAGNYTMTIKPNAASLRTISGSYAGGLIRLNGADRVTFDGDFVSDAGSNYLAIANTTTTGTIAAIQVISLGSGLGATNITIKNCNISCGHNAASSFGIFVGGASVSTSGTGVDNDNLTIQDNNISKCYYGIYARGIATTGELDNLSITGNAIGSGTATDYVTAYGINLQAVHGAIVSGNEIFNLIWDGSKYGIYLGSTVYNSVFSRNEIHTFNQSNTTSYLSIGMYFSSSTGATNNRIDNNLIYDLYQYGTTTNNYNVGIRIVGGDGYKIYFNSISMSGAFGSSTAGVYSHCLSMSTASTNMDIRNNIFSNTRTGNSPKTYAVNAVTGTTFTNINYNDYYTTGTAIGFYSSEIANLAAWQAATGQDANSIDTDPVFLSNSDLRVVSTSPVIAAGTPIAGIDYDFVNTDRDNISPSMGAYENGLVISCPFPSAQTTTLITNVGADMGWTDASGTYWDLYIVAGGDPAPVESTTPTVNDHNATSYTWTGGNGNTQYDWYVRSDCGQDNTDVSFWIGPNTFTTELINAIPYEEGFLTTSTPPGWIISGWTIGSIRGVTGNPGNNIYKNLWSSATTGTFTTVNIGPVTGAMELTFDFKLANYSSPYGPPASGSGNFIISVSIDFGATYTVIETVTNDGTAGWQSKIYDLSSYAGENIKIKIVGNWISGDYDLAFDNFKVQETVACPAPTDLFTSNITTSSATLNWSGPPIDSFFDVFFGPGSDPFEGQVVSGVSSPYSVSDLEPNTSYGYYVRTDCGFETPKVDNFWMAMDAPGNLLPPFSGGTADEPGEDGVWWLYDQAPGGFDWWNIWFYNDPVDTSRMKKIRMGFWIHSLNGVDPGMLSYVINWSDTAWDGPGFPTSTDEAFIHRSPVNGPGLIAPGPAQWIELYYIIPDYNPEWVSIDIWGENIMIEQIPMSPPPGSPLLAWWNPLMNGGLIVHECLPKTSMSLWSGPVIFTTGQLPAAVPFTETFETWPDNWTVVNGAQPNKWEVGTATAYNGTQSAYISNDGGTSNTYNIDAPSIVHIYRDISFTGGLGGYTLKFWWKGQGEGTDPNYWDYLRAYVIDPSTSPTSGTELTTGQVGLTYNLQGAWTEVSIDLSGTLTGSSKRVVFSWVNDDNTGTQPPIAIDDVSIGYTPYTWTGSVDSDWNNPGNWDKGLVPDASIKVIIPADPVSNPDIFPVISAAQVVSCYSMTVGTGASIVVQPGGTLNVLNP